ncbi:MAG: 2-hydroxyacid dehydrogenase [Bacteriovoracaceae bacterium]|nr:2-hydroxyacid dehydrogenase [Bacteriovoracaceae bacterium]
MKTIFFSTHDFERRYLDYWTEKLGVESVFLDCRLSEETLGLVKDADTISCWASDDLSRGVLQSLKGIGVKFISLRSAGFSHLDLDFAKDNNFSVARVPSYSPEAIAEHTLGLLMCLNRKFPRAYQRVKDFNFSLDGLEGVTLHGKNVGIVGVGKIGEAFARIMKGMGCNIYLSDPNTNEKLGKELEAQYVDLKTLLENSDVVSLHCPLNEKTKYLINKETIEFFKKDAFLLNTGRGALIDTEALIEKLKKKELRGVGLDVYEYEESIFSHDHSLEGISDEKLLRLMSFPNVLITSHQAFFTSEALDNIARISCENIKNFNDSLPINEQNFIC